MKKIWNPVSSYWTWSNVWCIKNHTKHSCKTLLRLVRFLMHQTLPSGHVLSVKGFVEILSWAEQSGTQFFSMSKLVIVSSSSAAQWFQFFDIWWSSFDIMNDVWAIFRKVFFRLVEILVKWKNYIFAFFKKNLLNFLLIVTLRCQIKE